MLVIGWLAVTLGFMLLRVAPTDGLTAVLQDSGASPALIAERIAANGLNEPLIMQYMRYLGSLARGDLGVSLLSGMPVGDLLLPAAGRTLTLAAAAFVLAVPLGMLIGGVADRGRRFASSAARVFITLSLAIPSFGIGYMLLLAVTFLLPGTRILSSDQVLVPALALAISAAGSIAKIVAAALAETRHAQFVVTARGMGYSEAGLLRIQILPTVASRILPTIGLQALFLIGGTVVTESIFARPGIGRLLVDSVLRRDYVIVQGIVLWAASCALLIQLVVDLAVAGLDPRVRESK